MTVQRIFMSGEAGHHNLGDEGMALACAARLQRYFPDAELVATGFDPLGAVLRHHGRIVPWPVTQYGLTSTYATRLARKVARKLGASEDFLDPATRPFDSIFSRHFQSSQIFRDVVQAMEEADFVFDMGHGGLNDVFDPFTLCFFYYLAGRLGKPLFISGQTIGPLWRPRSIRMIRRALRHAHTVGLRDRDVSCGILVDQVGIDPTAIRLIEVGDDTLDLTPEQPPFDAFDPAVGKLVQGGSFFAVQWRNVSYTGAPGTTEHLIPLVQAVAHLHARTGLVPVFVPLSWELAGDVLAAARMQDFIQDDFPFHVVWHPLDAAQAKWLLGRAQFGIGLSYHFHIFLLSQGIPTIGTYTNAYYHVKLQGAFAAYEHPARPFPYRRNIVDDPLFRESVAIVLAWDGANEEAARSAAHAQCAQWHRAFQAFLVDSHLIES